MTASFSPYLDAVASSNLNIVMNGLTVGYRWVNRGLCVGYYL